MTKRAKEIRALEADLKVSADKAEAELAAIGGDLERLDRARVRHAELSVCLGRLDALSASITGAGRETAKIRGSLEAIRVREEKLKGCAARIAEETAEREERMVEIGAGGWTRWKELPDPSPWRPAFEEVEKLAAESEGISRELREIDERKRGFFGGIVAFGSRLKKRGALNKIEKRRRDALAVAGAKLAAGGFARHAEGKLRLLFDFVEQKDRALAQLAEDRKDHEAVIARERAAIEAAAGGRKADQKLAELDEAMKSAGRDAKDTRTRAGRIYVDRDLRAEVADAALAARFEAVASLVAQQARIRAGIARHRAEEELETLALREQDLRKRRKTLEEERTIRERQIGEVDGELAAAQRRREELARIASGGTPPPTT